MYTLYYSPGAASLAIHAALREIGVPYELAKVDIDKGQQRSPDYLRLNPLGKIPTLVIDGKPVHESAALMLILAERHPHAGLAPDAGSLLRAEWYALIVSMATTFGAAFRLWFYPSDINSSTDDSATRDAVRAQIEAAFDVLDARLAAQGPYLLGEAFSGADLMLTMYMRWSRNMPRPATTWAALGKYADRMRARSSWKHVVEVEELTGW